LSIAAGPPARRLNKQNLAQEIETNKTKTPPEAVRRLNKQNLAQEIETNRKTAAANTWQPRLNKQNLAQEIETRLWTGHATAASALEQTESRSRD